MLISFNTKFKSIASVVITGMTIYFAYQEDHKFQAYVNELVQDEPIINDHPIEKVESKEIPVEKETILPYQSNNSFHKVDQYAKNCPESKASSIKSLARYLTDPYDQEGEAVRSIFSWIAYHIRYDDVSYNTDEFASMKAEDVFKRRTAVCSGYSRLFLAMCEAVGIETKYLVGYSKGYSYSLGQKFEDTDHAWNAVKIDGQWKLMDVTWASGYGKTVNGKLQSVQRFEDYWFDVDPKAFIFTHLPEQPRWQMIKNYIDLATYEILPYVRKDFFKVGFNPDIAFKGGLAGQIKVFPEVYRCDYELRVKQLPYVKHLKEEHVYKFVIESDYTKEIVAINEGEWIYFKKDGNVFTLEKGFDKGNLTISVKEKSKAHSFLKYVIDQHDV